MLAGTIPVKLLLQLTTAFKEGGLRDRSGTFFYKDHLHQSTVPVLALAGDRDLICPPDAVYGLFSPFLLQQTYLREFKKISANHFFVLCPLSNMPSRNCEALS